MVPGEPPAAPLPPAEPPGEELLRVTGLTRPGVIEDLSLTVRRGEIVGTFAVYHRTPYEPDGRDDELVERFTHLASLAVEHDRALRERAARHAADSAIGAETSAAVNDVVRYERSRAA